MGTTREIVTLQIGHYANFVGCHWWNLQESSFCYDQSKISEIEINHNVLFREGINPRKEATFTPRLIAIDLKGSLKTLKQEGILYDWQDRKHPTTLWNEKLDIYKTEPPKKNEFLEDLDKEESAYVNRVAPGAARVDEDKDVCQVDPATQVFGGKRSPDVSEKIYDLDDCVEVWSDYLKTGLHPKSIALIEDYYHDDEIEPFDTYGCGIQAFKNEQNKELVEERLRFFTEECDYLQGFHLLIDGYNGFSGYASGILQYLDDEYSTKARLSFPLYQPMYKHIWHVQSRMEEVHRLFTTLYCFENLSNYCSVFCPLSVSKELVKSTRDHLVPFESLVYNPSLPYHTSAIIAASLETITAPTRLKNSPSHLSEITQSLSCLGRKLMILGFSMPFPMAERESLEDVLARYSNKPLLTSLTPHCEVSDFEVAVQMAVVRGIPKERIYSSFTPPHSQLAPSELFANHLKQHSPNSSAMVMAVHQPSKVNSPFPNIFVPDIDSSGYLGSQPRGPTQRVKRTSSAASLINSTGAANLLGAILKDASRTDFTKYHRCLEAGIEGDDILEMLQNLHQLRENYVENMDVDLDDDDV